MTKKMKTRLVEALRAAIAMVENGMLDDDAGDVSFVSVHAEGFEFHDTPEQAEVDAQEELDYRRDQAGDDTGWHPGVGSIGWGVYVPVQVVDVIDKGPDPRRPQFDTMLEVTLREWGGNDGDDGEYIDQRVEFAERGRAACAAIDVTGWRDGNGKCE